MKQYLFISIIALSFLFNSCEEDIREPIASDGIKPGKVSNVEAINLPGGAELTYKMPSDKDLLYVMAEYELKNGKKGSVKSTIYNNSLRIIGLGDTDPHKINLYAVDRGELKSDPVEVIINPLPPPVKTIGSSLYILPDFGGAHLFWENESELEVAFIVMTKDSLGQLNQVDIKYSSFLTDDFAVRGFNTDSREFIVIVRDRWDNFSDTIKATLEPLFEELLDKNNFSFIQLPHDTPSAWGWVGPRMMDFNIGSGYHTAQGWADPDPLPTYGDKGPHICTFDLGVTAKLSRWKFWQRQGSWIFKHGNPRIFDVWGAKELNASGTFDGWVKLIENGEVIKPSGLPIGTNTNDDKEQAAAGEEFSFPLDAEAVRYIRFVSLESWSGARFMHIMEVDFWGQIQSD